MKNYYEILEVNEKASKEVIEKAYKVLIKKYHPDLHTGDKQKYAEKKSKEINEAYKVLSDDFLREQYDTEIKKQEINHKQKSYQEQKNQNTKKVSNNQINQKKDKSNSERQTKNYKIGSFGAIIELAKELIHDLAKNKERRQEIKEVTKKDVIAIILTIIIVALIGVVLWFIPFTNGWMRELLFENPIFTWIGMLFSK